MILNRNSDFNKGINKILKMIVTLPQEPQVISDFLL